MHAAIVQLIVDTFKASLDPSIFKLYRKYLYSRYKETDELSQGEVVHEKAKERLQKIPDSFAKNAFYFDAGNQLEINLAGNKIPGPVGLAAGFDKNCELLIPTSYVFGFLSPGSVARDPRQGNPQHPRSKGTVRLAIDDERESIINAQGYPQKGLDYTVEKLMEFRAHDHGRAKLLLNFSGITDVLTEDAVLDSCKEIISRTIDYVDFGFEENRTSPNTDFNKKLQTPEFTKKMIDVMNSTVPNKLVKVSKIAPYSKIPPSEEEVESRMKSIEIFYENGGHAVTIGNTRSVNTKQMPKAMRFARQVAGESGRPLFPYMLKMVLEARKRFPELAIIACGGISEGQDAWQAYESGATLVELYTALTFRGFGVVRHIHETLRRRLGARTLQEFVDERMRK